MSPIRYIGFIAGTVALFLAAACAKQGSPSGGPKDETPPVVIRSVPENGTTNFISKTITITFNEFVILDKIQEKFMMSPPVDEKPEISIRGKNMIIAIEEQLRDSTTYTLYFQDAIRDLNESNILENYQYSFSTGNYMDSLSLTGLIRDGFTLEVPEKMLVMLYSNLSDTAPMTIIPDYISTTDPTGYFTLNNLRAGEYRLYALADINTNRRYEPGDETFAFLSENLFLTTDNYFKPADTTILHQPGDTTILHQPDDTSSTHIHRREPDHILYSFKTPPQRYYLASAVRRQARLLEYYMSMPLDTMKFSFSAANISEDGYFTDISRNRDTFRIWLRDSIAWSNPLIETVISFPQTGKDGTVSYVTDTVPMRYIAPRATRGTVATRGLGFRSNAGAAGIPPKRNIRLVPEAPLLSVDTTLMSIISSGDSLEVLYPFACIFDPLSPGIVTLQHDLPEGKDYMLRMWPGALTSIYGETNDTAQLKFRVRPAGNYGTLNLTTKGYEGPVIVQLLDNRENIAMESTLSSPGNLLFRFIENGKYRLRVIYDDDENGKWTPGDFAAGRQPESVSFFPEELEIKSNWDLEQEWDIAVRNQKDEKLMLIIQTRR